MSFACYNVPFNFPSLFIVHNRKLIELSLISAYSLWALQLTSTLRSVCKNCLIYVHNFWLPRSRKRPNNKSKWKMANHYHISFRASNVLSSKTFADCSFCQDERSFLIVINNLFMLPNLYHCSQNIHHQERRNFYYNVQLVFTPNL